MPIIPRINFTVNPKQAKLYELVIGALSGENNYRIFHYGGAFRGGKSYAQLGLGHGLCLHYPNTKGYIIRADYTRLSETSVPVMKKITETERVSWREFRGVPIMNLANGSSIRFLSENIDKNPDLDHFKGLEANWFIFEQIEEVQQKTYQMAMSRLGSWDKSICPAFMFTNFNPAFNWVKEAIYDRAKQGEQLEEWCFKMSDREIFIEAFPEDNPFNTKEQWDAWEMLDDETRSRFIKGEWEIDVKGRFMAPFNRADHVKPVSYDDTDILRLSFDFNVDPMTCIAYQTDKVNYFRVIKEFRQQDSNSFQICQDIKQEFELGKVPVYMVTGDPSGRNRTRGISKPISDFDIIRKELFLGSRQIVAPKAHSKIGVSRIMCNSILTHFPEFTIDPSCEWLIKDMDFVLRGLDSQGDVTIQKTGMNPYINISNKEMGHLMDCLRYAFETDLKQWVKIPRS